MNKLIWKRNYKLIIIFVFIILGSLLFYKTRIISYNFGKYNTQLEIAQTDVKNNISIFDDSIFHQIYIDIDKEQYEYILQSYKNNKEKEFVSVNITIDGKTIKNVGLRLKGNLDLLSLITQDKFITPAFLIQLDKYEKGQNYQGLNELAFRVDNLESMIGQMIANKITNNLSIYSPLSSFAKIKFGEYGSYNYTVFQVINEQYISKNFDFEGVVYKALNSLSFNFLGEDPTLYTSLFEQKTLKNNYDMKLLINILEFITKSSDTEFEDNLHKYIDIDSYTNMLVMEQILQQESYLLGLLNNYYIYVDKNTNKAYFVLRDQKMSFGDLNSNFYQTLLKYYSNQDINDIEKIGSLVKFTQTGIKIEDNIKNNIYQNILKTRFMKTEKYKKIYEQKLIEYKNIIYQGNLALDILDDYLNLFKENNISNEIEYNFLFSNIENYILNFKY